MSVDGCFFIGFFFIFGFWFNGGYGYLGFIKLVGLVWLLVDLMLGEIFKIDFIFFFYEKC